MATLSKSRFVRGVQCPNLLWWTTHDRDAPELKPGPAQLDRFRQGTRVGRMARDRFPGGVLVEAPGFLHDKAVSETRKAIDSRAPAVFEAAFLEDDVFVAVDVLERDGDTFNVIEVKSSTQTKPEHLVDAAIQTHVVERSGLKVGRTELMHLNGDHRHPDDGDLFTREDVTPETRGLRMGIEQRVRRQLEIVSGPFPDRPVGAQCVGMTDCPFKSRCWPDEPHHIRTLYGAGTARALEYMQQGIHSVAALPETRHLTPVARRQCRAVRRGAPVVEPGLWMVLDTLDAPVGYLDLETVSRAVPVWRGVAPWQAVPVQFSYHEERDDGTHRHVGWLADGPADPREALARALISTCAKAGSIVVYGSYENTQIRALQEDLPHLAEALERVRKRLFNLLPVVRNHVYHPEFRGSFSIKRVVPALLPELAYDDLAVRDGDTAGAQLARLLFDGEAMAPGRRASLRRELLAYCKRDTWALVVLLAELRELGLEV